jgi:hypothetical protein
MDGTAYAFNVHLGVSFTHSRVRVKAPWLLAKSSSNNMCISQGTFSSCLSDVFDFFVVATADPNAPSRNILFETSNQVLACPLSEVEAYGSLLSSSA